MKIRGDSLCTSSLSDLDPTGWRVGDETFATFHEAEDAAFGIASVPFSPEPC